MEIFYEKYIYFAPTYLKRGAFNIRAEIIPIEPDTGNAVEGRENRMLSYKRLFK